ADLPGEVRARVGDVGRRGGHQQPFCALLTAVISSSIDTPPLPLRSNDRQLSKDALPSAMWTPAISSLIATLASPLQSPAHAGTVAVGEAVMVAVVEAVALGVAEA